MVFLDDIEGNAVAAGEVGMHAVPVAAHDPGNHRGQCEPFGCGWLGLTADGATGYTEELSDDDHSFHVIGQIPELTHKATLWKATLWPV